MLKIESYLVIVLNNNSLRRKLNYVLETILSRKWFLELNQNWRIVSVTDEKKYTKITTKTIKKTLNLHPQITIFQT